MTDEHDSDASYAAVRDYIRTRLAGQLDRAKATVWGFVRSIDYWLWGLENGLTSDPLRCQRVASALAPLAEHSNQSCDWHLRLAGRAPATTPGIGNFFRTARVRALAWPGASRVGPSGWDTTSRRS